MHIITNKYEGYIIKTMRIFISCALIASAGNASAMKRTMQDTLNKTESAWDILTGDALTQISAYCDSSSRNNLMYVSKELNFFASKCNKNILYQNTVNLSKEDALYYMTIGCSQGKFNLVTNLLNNDVDPNEKDLVYGGTALHAAVRCDHIKIVRLLLDHKNIQINEIDKDGNTALHVAAEKGYGDSIVALLACPDIQVNENNNEDESPLFLAMRGGHIKSVECLLAQKIIMDIYKNTDCGLLSFAIFTGNAKAVDFLLTHKYVQVDEEYQGLAPIFLACSVCTSGMSEIVKTLLSHGADVDAGIEEQTSLSLVNDILRNGLREIDRQTNTLIYRPLTQDQLDSYRDIKALLFLSDARS